MKNDNKEQIYLQEIGLLLSILNHLRPEDYNAAYASVLGMSGRHEELVKYLREYHDHLSIGEEGGTT